MDEVREYLGRFVPGYYRVAERGYHKRGIAAYEALFNVANRTDDLIEAREIIEREGLIWNLTREEDIDLLETQVQGMDPLDEEAMAPMNLQLRAVLDSSSEEELEYRLELAEYEAVRIMKHALYKKMLVKELSYSISRYETAKSNLWQ
ncbi:MAG: hypothetical protein ACOX4I_03350 [Anaerovoracaceae bacterium]|jgi:hypothetical protein